jgi:hypothetical protein
VPLCHEQPWHCFGTLEWSALRHARRVRPDLDRMPLLDERRVPRLAFAPRLDPRLHRRLVRLDRPDVAIAETHRRLGAYAWSIGVFRPSYEHVRRLVHALRALRRARARGRRTTATLLVEAVYNLKPPRPLVDHVLDAGPPAPP